jgi:hypothetical protein
MHPRFFLAKICPVIQETEKEDVLIIRWYSVLLVLSKTWGGHDRDRIVVEFTTKCAISAYHH